MADSRRAETPPDPDRLRHGCAQCEEDGEGWVVIVCDCGRDLGQFPDYLTAVDALIDHVLERLL